MVAITTWLPAAVARARWNCASRARNSALVCASSSIASSRASASVRSGSSAWASSPITAVSSSSRVRTTSVTGKPWAATWSRISTDMPSLGAAVITAPEVGPDPVWVRSRPSTSSTRTASRTLDRPTPSSAARARSGTRWSPGFRAPLARSLSIRPSTTCQARWSLIVLPRRRVADCGQTVWSDHMSAATVTRGPQPAGVRAAAAAGPARSRRTSPSRAGSSTPARSARRLLEESMAKISSS